jgi:hypothetical protein
VSSGKFRAQGIPEELHQLYALFSFISV